MENTGWGAAGRLPATGCPASLTSGSEIQRCFHCRSLMDSCTLDAPFLVSLCLKELSHLTQHKGDFRRTDVVYLYLDNRHISCSQTMSNYSSDSEANKLISSLFLVPPDSVLYCSAKHCENKPNRQHWHTSQVNLTNGTEKLTEKKEVLRPTVTGKVLSWFLFTHHAGNLTCFPAAYWRDSVCESAGCLRVSPAKTRMQFGKVEKVQLWWSTHVSINFCFYVPINRKGV